MHVNSYEIRTNFVRISCPFRTNSHEFIQISPLYTPSFVLTPGVAPPPPHALWPQAKMVWGRVVFSYSFVYGNIICDERHMKCSRHRERIEKKTFYDAHNVRNAQNNPCRSGDTLRATNAICAQRVRRAQRVVQHHCWGGGGHPHSWVSGVRGSFTRVRTGPMGRDGRGLYRLVRRLPPRHTHHKNCTSWASPKHLMCMCFPHAQRVLRCGNACTGGGSQSASVHAP